MKRLWLAIIMVLCFGLVPCSMAQGHFGFFSLPMVPDELKSPSERASYLCLHYWDNFDFADKKLIDTPEITEQAFVDFLSILPYTDKAGGAIDNLLHRSSVDLVMLKYIISLADKYLYEPNSPMYSEQMYGFVLSSLLVLPTLIEADKAVYRFRQEMIMKNRVGEKAVDFTYLCKNGDVGTLYKLTAPYVLVFFNDPDCDHCRRVKENLETMEVLAKLVDSGRLTLLSVCVEGETASWKSSLMPRKWIDACDEKLVVTEQNLYDLRALPALYLLDSSKTVLLKDASVQQLSEFCQGL